MSLVKYHSTNRWSRTVAVLSMRSLFAAFLVSVTACSSGDSAGFCFSDSRPIISNLEVTPALVVVGEGGGTVNVDVSFDYQQTDEWIFLVIYNVYSAAGTQVLNSDFSTDLRGSGIHTFSIPINTARVETYRITVYVTDRCFEESNLIDADLQVVEA